MNSLNYNSSISMEDIDKSPDELSQMMNNGNKNLLVNKKSKAVKRAITSVKSNIIDTYRSLFSIIWMNCYLRISCLSGHAQVYSTINKYDCIVAESVLSQIMQVVSVATLALKQPSLEGINKNSDGTGDKEKSISLVNKIIDKIFYENIDSFVNAFETSLKYGIGFVHLDSRQIYADGIQINELSPYNCIWDFNVKAKDIHKSSFFLIEEYVDSNTIRSMYGNEEIERALKVTSSEVDTFPLNEIESIIKNNKNVVEGEKFKIDKKNYQFQFQIKNELGLGQHKLSTIYFRSKKPFINDLGVKTFNSSVEKIVFVNDQFIESVELGCRYIPIIMFSPLEQCAYNKLSDKYQSLYDHVSSELLQLAIQMSSVSSCSLNAANNPIFINETSIPASSRDSKILRNKVVPVKNSQDRPISEMIMSLPNNGIVAGATELIMMLKSQISAKFNLLTSEISAAKSTKHEELRLDNQINMSSKIIQGFDRSISQFAEVSTDLIRSLSIHQPDKIQEILDIQDEELDINSVARIAFAIDKSRIILTESDYFTTKSEKDLRKIEQISIITGKNISIPLHVLLQTANISVETIEYIKKSEEQKDKLQEEATILENTHKKLVIELEKKKIESMDADNIKKQHEVLKIISSIKIDEDKAKIENAYKQILINKEKVEIELLKKEPLKEKITVNTNKKE